MFLKPREGMKVYDPAQKNFLPPEGREVGNDHALFWHRIKQDGDVEELSAAEAEKSLADAAAAAKAETDRIAAEETAKKKAEEAAKPKDPAKAAAPAAKGA